MKRFKYALLELMVFCAGMSVFLYLNTRVSSEQWGYEIVFSAGFPFEYIHGGFEDFWEGVRYKFKPHYSLYLTDGCQCAVYFWPLVVDILIAVLGSIAIVVCVRWAMRRWRSRRAQADPAA